MRNVRRSFAPFPIEVVDISAVSTASIVDVGASAATTAAGDLLLAQALTFDSSPLDNSIASLAADHQPLLDQAGAMLTSFSDQKGTLAGTFFMGSLPPYLAFLYFLGFEGNRTPKLTQFGFSYLLLFVAATIPTGIISKSVFGLSLADVDWLHGSAEFLLTVSNVLVVLGLRAALLGDAEGPAIRGRDTEGTDYDDAPLRLAAGGLVLLVGAFCASGVNVLELGAHVPFLGGAGALPSDFVASLGLPHAEPDNALSVPTWAVHFSSVFEFVFAMNLVWRYAEATGKEEWKGLAWGMLPSHASGVAACTYHFFFNAKSVAFLVTLQAFLTALGNTTLAVACYRIAVANGWALQRLDPRQIFDESLRLPSMLPPPLSSSSSSSPETGADLTAGSAAVSSGNPFEDLFKTFAAGLPNNKAAAAAAEAADQEAKLQALQEEEAKQLKVASYRARTADLESAPLLAAKIIAATVVCSYVVKYGELALDAPFQANPVLAGAMLVAPPLLVAADLVRKSEPEWLLQGSSDGGDGKQGGGLMSNLSMADVKKFGVSGTIAYVLTELAFWAVAFPAASSTFYATAGHWPDLASSPADRAAVLGFVFGAANVARLAVPLRFGAALALAPWVDENIVAKFATGGATGGEDGDSE